MSSVPKTERDRSAQRKPTEEEAFRIYYEMGSERSLPRLEVRLRRTGYEISLKTLQKWSALHSWRDKIEFANRQHVKAVKLAAEEASKPDVAKIEQVLAGAVKMEQIALLAFERVEEALKRKGKGAITVKSIDDARKLLDVAADLADRALDMRVRMITLVPEGALHVTSRQIDPGSSPPAAANAPDSVATGEVEVIPPPARAIDVNPSMNNAVLSFQKAMKARREQG